MGRPVRADLDFESLARIVNLPDPAADQQPLTRAFAAKLFTLGSGLINGKIVESRAANAATYAVKTLAGDDPSSATPVWVVVSDGAGSIGLVVLTAALSLTINSGATLGASNGVAFRLWFEIFNDGGTARLGVKNCSTGGSAPRIYPLDESQAASSTAMGTGADSAGVFYTGAAVTTKYYAIIGFADYASGLTTAGTWNVAPTLIQLFGPGIHKPGEVIQRVLVTSSTATQVVNSSAITATALAATIEMTSAVNHVRASATGIGYTSNGNGILQVQFGRTSSSNLFGGSPYIYSAGNVYYQIAIFGVDKPNATGNITYTVYGNSDVANLTWMFNAQSYASVGTCLIEEIMG